MQKVAMSHSEVKKSINSQILTVFILPIAMAVVHIIVAFPILTKLLSLMYITNTTFFVLYTVATVLAFSIIYTIVYFLTSRVYYKISNQK